MTTEELQTPEPVAEQQQESPQTAPSQEDAAFVSGFNDQPVEESTPAEPEPPAPETQPEPEKPEPPPVDPVAELRDYFNQRENKIFGSLGSLRQQIEQIKLQPTSAGIKLTKDHLKRVAAEFPEMADVLVEDLNEAFQNAVIAGNAQPSAQATEQVIASRLEQQSQAYERKFLTLQHKDWESVVTSDEFKKWVGNLPPEDQQTLGNTWDSMLIGQKLSEFKDWKSKAVQTKQSNQRRLEAAVTPRGNPQKPPAPSADDEFVRGFKEALGPR